MFDKTAAAAGGQWEHFHTAPSFNGDDKSCTCWDSVMKGVLIEL